VDENLRAAGTLALRNVKIVEQACDVLGEIDTELVRTVNGLVKKMLPKADWKSGLFEDADLESADDISFYPVKWEEDEECLASFDLWYYESDSAEDSYWASILCEQSSGRTGIYWWISEYKKIGATKGKWKNFLRQHSDLVQAITASGFMLQDDEWFWLPVVADIEALATAYQNDELEDYLEPIYETALKTVFEATPKFDRLLQAAQQFFGETPVESAVA
jgi:hypothetical protein